MQDISTPDPTKMTEEELYRLNIYHAADDGYSEKQLHSLYGLVNEDQDREIISAVQGKRVLDVGAGYGSLSRRLKEAGFEVTAIEPNQHTRALAKKWNNVEGPDYDDEDDVCRIRYKNPEQTKERDCSSLANSNDKFVRLMYIDCITNTFTNEF